MFLVKNLFPRRCKDYAFVRKRITEPEFLSMLINLQKNYGEFEACSEKEEEELYHTNNIVINEYLYDKVCSGKSESVVISIIKNYCPFVLNPYFTKIEYNMDKIIGNRHFHNHMVEFYNGVYHLRN